MLYGLLFGDFVEPTQDECTNRATREIVPGVVGHCGYFPQLDGYHGKMIAIPQSGGCIDLLVWHDGAFPFAGANSGDSPRELHICDAAQWLRFGEWLASVSKRTLGNR